MTSLPLKESTSPVKFTEQLYEQHTGVGSNDVRVQLVIQQVTQTSDT